jgi:uncharacterized protein (DUF427 family)
VTGSAGLSKADLLERVRRYRGLRPFPKDIVCEALGPGQESVWDFPRPPRIEPVEGPARVLFAGKVVAETEHLVRVVETAGAPCYYFPPDEVDWSLLDPSDETSVCEWKGLAVHYDLVVGPRRSPAAAWAYPDPFDDLPEGYEDIAGYPAFYPGRTDGCELRGERVRPQPGGYYGGWVTQSLAGPIKGEPGSEGW